MSLPEDLKKEFPELEQPESLWETLERDLNELLAQHSSAKRTNVQTGFLKKVIKGSPSSNNQMRLENSGSRIASLSGLKEAPKLVDELSGNPMNSKARLDLVEMVIRKTDGKDALVNRDTFLRRNVSRLTSASLPSVLRMTISTRSSLALEFIGFPESSSTSFGASFNPERDAILEPLFSRRI